MTEKEAFKWLDTVVDSINAINALDKQNDVEICEVSKSMHIFSNIWALCEAIGVKPIKAIRNDTQYNIEIYFDYRGIRFFELCRAKIPEFDIETAEIELKENEHIPSDDVYKAEGVFKDMKEVIDTFDKQTTYSHEGSGVLGKVE